MAKRKKQRRSREKAPTVDYVDAEAASLEDAWRRRSEALFERLAVRWEIAGLPLNDQKMLLGRYRMADAETQRWVRQTIAEHLQEHIPELAG